MRPFLGIEPPLFALPLLRAPNRNHRVGAAASDSTHTESVAPTADTESPPLDQVLQVEATAIVTVPMRGMMEEREAAELEIKTSSSGRRHCIYGNAIPNSQAEVEREREVGEWERRSSRCCWFVEVQASKERLRFVCWVRRLI